MTGNITLHKPWPIILLVLLISALALFSRVEAQEAKGPFDIGSSKLRLSPQGSWEWQNTILLKKSADGIWDAGTETTRFSDKTLRSFYHEKFEYVGGELRILKPMTVIDATPMITGEIASETYDGCNMMTCYEGGTCWVTTAYCAKSKLSEVTTTPAVHHDGAWRTVYVQNNLAQATVEPLIGTTTPTICGMNIKGQNELSRLTELIQVTCPPWAALSAAGLPVTPGRGPQTQVLVHVREGDTFTAEVDGKWKEAGVLRDLGWIAPGFKGGMIVFDGVGFTSLKIAIQSDIR